MTTITADQLFKGQSVAINPRNDRTREQLIQGQIDELLTNSNSHPHGILVRLTSGEIGRVKSILEKNESSSFSSNEDSGHSKILTPDLKELPDWLQSDNPYFLREINSLRDKLEAKFSQDEWRNQYHDNGISGSLQELTKLLEKSVETIFKLPLFLIHDSSEMLESLYNKSSSHAPFAYRFAASTDLLAKINFLFNDIRKKEKLINIAYSIDSDVGLLFERIGDLDNAAITSVNSIRNFRNYLSHPQNDILSQSKTRFIVDYALMDFKEIHDLGRDIT